MSLYITDGADAMFDVVIYVPSARGNFDQRNAIRDTWLGHISQNETLQNRFVAWLLFGIWSLSEGSSVESQCHTVYKLFFSSVSCRIGYISTSVSWQDGIKGT